MLFSTHSSPTITTLFFLLLLPFPHLSATSPRRLLHHPFFPLSPSIAQPPSLPPSSPPSPLPLHPPSSSISDFSGNTNNNNLPFFPSSPSSPPPPPPPLPPSSTALPTFPANISSLSLPSTSSPPSHSPLSSKLIIILILLSLLTLSLIISLSLLLHRRRNNHHHLHFSPQKPISPIPPPPPPPSKPPTHNLSHTSTDFLYVTNSLTNSRDFQPTTSTTTTTTTTIEPPHSSEFYLKLCGDESPELRPLPPLPKTTTTSSSQHLRVTFDNNVQIHYKDNDDFFSPTTLDSENNDNFGLNISPTRSCSDFPCSDSDVSVEIQTLAARTHHFPAPPPPPAHPGVGPPPLVPPSGPVVFKSSGNLGEKRKSGERKEESGTMKTKLKALHWDKVRASSDRVMVWDHLHPGSFQ